MRHWWSNRGLVSCEASALDAVLLLLSIISYPKYETYARLLFYSHLPSHLCLDFLYNKLSKSSMLQISSLSLPSLSQILRDVIFFFLPFFFSGTTTSGAPGLLLALHLEFTSGRLGDHMGIESGSWHCGAYLPFCVIFLVQILFGDF